MNKEEVFGRLEPIIKTIAEVDSSFNLAMSMDLKDLGINSISIIKLVVEIENEFDIEFDDDMRFEGIQSLNDLVECIMEAL